MEVLNFLEDYDRQLFARLFKQRASRTHLALLKLLSRSGEGVLHALIPLAIWQLQLPGSEAILSLILLSFALERCLHYCLKNTLKRPRPQSAIPGLRSLGPASNQFSFPSGHSSRAFLLATSLVVVYGAPALFMYVWAAAVAMSRVLLGVHYPGDTLAGAFTGSCTALFSATLLGLI